MIDAEGKIKCDNCHKRLNLAWVSGEALAYCDNCKHYTLVSSKRDLTSCAIMERKEVVSSR